MEAALFTKRDLIVGGCIFVAETIRINLQTPSQFIRRWGESGCRLSTSIIPSAHAAFEINVSFNNVQFGAFVQRQIYIFPVLFYDAEKIGGHYFDCRRRGRIKNTEDIAVAGWQRKSRLIYIKY
jgi:hypothetical protein